MHTPIYPGTADASVSSGVRLFHVVNSAHSRRPGLHVLDEIQAVFRSMPGRLWQVSKTEEGFGERVRPGLVGGSWIELAG